MVGIVGYGAYVPKYRIKSEVIAQVWGEDPDRIKKGLGINEKAIASSDEDAATLAVEAAKIALQRAGIAPKKLGALYVGSESHPYAVKPTATIVAEAIGATPDLTAADLEFACKAGTAGIQMCMGLVGSGMMEYGMAIGADTSQGRPGDALEYSTGCGAAAYIIGKDGESLAIIEDTHSFTTDTPDFWRRNKADYPSHGGRFTGPPAYFRHVKSAALGLMKKMNTKVEDYDYFVFHQPNGKFPKAVAKMLGVPPEKIADGLLTPNIGNTYSGASPLGLANVLDIAKAGDRIFVTSFGSGAGSDAFSIKVTDRIKNRERGKPVSEFIAHKEYVDYATYAKYRRKFKGM
ncbi:MAG: hydroxymethylglutaryl-CoA synthase [Candidatus ainarchaeum sp.]|nr:hydroxymethylglutaryl-CoA synthase [Candidatus ainarchaeum sp.]MDD5096104.1 hydroxymethylglutaryl-CoA synthase [Candidatus ainarchaeum sp.]